MNASRIVAPAVVGLGLILGAVGGIQVLDSENDYARLFPAPDAVAWTQGKAQTLWLETNLPGVELRVSGLEDLDDDTSTDADDPALGIAQVYWRDIDSNAIQRVGQGAGCRDDYDNPGVAVDDPATMRDERTGPYNAYSLLAGHGVAILPCVDEHADPGPTSGVVGLYDADGELLAEYELRTPDPGATPLATPLPVVSSEGNRPPAWSDGDYALRVVCVDEAGNKADFFDGLPSPGEMVGDVLAVVDPDGDSLTVSLAAEQDYAWFVVDSVTGGYQLSLSELGPNDDTGLDVERLYSLKLLADDGRGGRDSLAVTVQVDEGRLATGVDADNSGLLENDERDGICP